MKRGATTATRASGSNCWRSDCSTMCAGCSSDLPHTCAVLARIERRLAPDLDACGTQELAATRPRIARPLRARRPERIALARPARRAADWAQLLLGRHARDPHADGMDARPQVGARLVELHLQEHGDYPVAMGLSVWGTATMRTGGDDLAQAFALIGVRPKWAPGSQRVVDFEVLPTVGLGRPRIDVTLRISGFFRDAFPAAVQMFDAAVQAVARRTTKTPSATRFAHASCAKPPC
jgi:cobaltochelatase CobN